MTDLPHHDTPEGQLLEAFMHAIWDERHRAHDKHGATSMEQAPLLAHKRASVLTEEAVECARALNDHEHGEIVLRENLHEVGQRISGLPVRGIAQVGPIVDPLDKELIQTAAMAYTWWANRRGDQLAPPVQKPIRGGRTQTISVFINGTPHIGVIDPVTGNVLVSIFAPPVIGATLHDAAAGEEVEVQIPPIPPIPVRKSSDLSFHEVSFDPPGPPVVEVTAEQARAMGMRVREPECVANWPGCYEGGYDPRCCRFPKSCSCEVVPEPPADDPDGGRRGD